jgi:hypothetical protein
MTLPSSGPLSLNQINNEFGRGRNLNAYRGTQWFTDGGSSGTFTSSNLGFDQFYGKRPDAPYRFGTPSGFYTPVSSSSGNVTLSITNGQPFDSFVIYAINSIGAPTRPPGNIAPYPGTLDSNGNWSQTSFVFDLGTPNDNYWFPLGTSNTFYFYQGVSSQPTPLPPNTSPSSYIGQVTLASRFP